MPRQDPGQPVRSRSPEQVEENRFGLVVKLLPQGDLAGSVLFGRPQQKTVADNPGGLRSGKLPAGPVCRNIDGRPFKRQRPGLGQPAHRLRLLARLGPDSVVEVGDNQGQPVAGRQDAQKMEQAKRIGPSGDGHEHAVALIQEPVPLNKTGYFFY